MSHLPNSAPVVVSFGGGVDSTALLIEMVRRGERIDRVLFADTGGEKPETYEHVEWMSGWLADEGYPAVETVRYKPVRAPYSTLEGNCLANETLPSLSFARRGCSIKWKHDALDRYVQGVSRGLNKADALPEWHAAQRAGLKITRVIGYDAGEVAKGRGRDRRTGTLIREDERYVYRYPLIEWGWNRARCIEVITAQGLPVPLKSACFFCPASKPWELLWLAGKHPDLFLRAIAIEDKARRGKHGIGKVGGLGGYAGPERMRNWRAWAESEGVLEPGGNQVVADAAELLERAEILSKPTSRPTQLSLFPEVTP